MGSTERQAPDESDGRPAGVQFSLVQPRRASHRSRRAAWISGLTAVVLSAAFLTVALYSMKLPEGSGPRLVYRELYLTDRPVGFDHLYLSVDHVTFAGFGLGVAESRFDLLAHRGPEGAFLLASGHVPEGAEGTVEVAFSGAEGCLSGRCAPIPLEAATLVLRADAEAILLIDLDADQSLRIDSEGRIAFRPVAAAVYAKAPGVAHAAWEPIATGSADASPPSAPALPTETPAPAPPSPPLTTPPVGPLPTTPTPVPTGTPAPTPTGLPTSTTPASTPQSAPISPPPTSLSLPLPTTPSAGGVALPPTSGLLP